MSVVLFSEAETKFRCKLKGIVDRVGDFPQHYFMFCRINGVPVGVGTIAESANSVI